MALSADGLTIIGVGTGNRSFLASTRSAVGQTDFGVATGAAFVTLDAALPAGGSVAYPAQSADGLAFYFQVGGATDSSMNGIYEALRTKTSAPFAAATKMPAAVQAYEAVTGISADRMTLFVTAGFMTSMMTRTSLLQPFAVSTATPPSSAFRVAPVGDCAVLFGTCEPGGCQGETICIWTKH